jgi:hypothetical protein
MSDTPASAEDLVAPEAPVYLSDTDIEILNAARNIIKEARGRTPHTWRGGVATTKIDQAQDAIFEALSAVHIYLDQPMTDEQVYGRRVLEPTDQLVDDVAAVPQTHHTA